MSGERLKLDREHLLQMVRSPDFYIRVPAFLYLQEVAQLSHQAYLDSTDCEQCRNDWKFMRGVCDAFFVKLQELKRNEDPALEDIKEWLSSRKGYKIGTVVLYYRRSHTQGKIAKFTF